MIKITKITNEIYDGDYFQDKTRRKFYLCVKGQKKIFGFSPEIIKIYTKNPKEKGAVKVVRLEKRYLEIQGDVISIDYTAAYFITDVIKSNTFWIRAVK